MSTITDSSCDHARPDVHVTLAAPSRDTIEAPAADSKYRRKAHWLVLLLIVMAAFGIYLPALHHGVVLDDRQYLMDNALLRASDSFLYPLNFIEFVRNAQRIGLDPDIALNFIMRPVTYATFYWNRLAGGADPAGYRMVNMLIHAVNGCLIFVILTQLIRRGQKTTSAGFLFAPAAAALLFTVHPLATESVTYVVQRFESLSTMFYLAAVALFLGGQLSTGLWSGWLMRALVPLAVLGAMLSKEIGVTAPLMILLMDRICLGSSWKRALQRCLPVLVLLPVIPVMLMVTSWVQTGDGSLWQVINITNIGLIRFSPFEYAVTQVCVCLRYLQMLILPLNQNFDPEFPLITSIQDIRFILAFHGILALLYIGWQWHRRLALQMGSLGFFGILWFFITLTPSSSLVPLPDLMAEHRSYLPSVGVFFVFAALLNCFREAWAPMAAKNRTLWIVTAVWVIALGGATLARNEVLRDDETIYRDVIAKCPQRARAWNGLATALVMKGGENPDEVISCLEKAVSLSPNFGMARENLVIMLVNYRQYEKSLKESEALLLESPDNIRMLHHQGVALFHLNRLPQATEAFLRAVRVSPHFRDSNLCLGAIFAHTKNYRRARHHYQAAMTTGPLPQTHLAILSAMPNQQDTYTDNAGVNSADALTRSILGAQRY